MSSPLETKAAEQRFREAFERLKANRPNTVPMNTPISQNNVAKEAGLDPSALRKARYPGLVREIQQWLGDSDRKSRRAERARPRLDEAMKNRIAELTRQRDYAQSALLEANASIRELKLLVADLQARCGKAM